MVGRVFKGSACFAGLLAIAVLVACQRPVDLALIDASAAGDVQKVDDLLNQGADIEVIGRDGWTPLTVAAERGNIDVVELLLERGAQINAPESGGHTALFWALYRTHRDTADLLTEKGGIAPNGGILSPESQR